MRSIRIVAAVVGSLAATTIGDPAAAEIIDFEMTASVVTDGPISGGYNEAEIRFAVNTTASPVGETEGVARYALPGPNPLTVTFRDESPTTSARTFSIRCAKAQLATHLNSGFYAGYTVRGFDCIDDQLKIAVLALVLELSDFQATEIPSLAPPSSFNIPAFEIRDLRITGVPYSIAAPEVSEFRATIASVIFVATPSGADLAAFLALSGVAWRRRRAALLRAGFGGTPGRRRQVTQAGSSREYAAPHEQRLLDRRSTAAPTWR